MKKGVITFLRRIKKKESYVYLNKWTYLKKKKPGTDFVS